jgi:hypothetical protein
MTSAVMTVSGALLIFPMAGAASATAVASPSDPATAGPLTLCNQQGQQVTTGSLAAKPAIWRVVDSTGAAPAYAKGGTATLYAFQPRPSTPPDEWTGEQLTASARYPVVGHPSAAATPADESLATYLTDYPLLTSARLVELRVYLAATNAPASTSKYDASYLHVGNGTWTELNPGPADCAAGGRAVSLETLTLPAKTFKVKATARPTQPASGSGSRSTSQTSPLAARNDASSTALGATTADRAGSSDTGRDVAIGICVALLVAIGASYGLRRRT